MLRAGVGAAILNVAPSVIPQGLLTGALTLAFDMRVVAFCVLRCRDVYRWAAVRLLSLGRCSASIVGPLFGFAPAWQATDLSTAHVIASGSRKHAHEQTAIIDVLAERIPLLGGVSVAVAHDVAERTIILFRAGRLAEARSEFKAAATLTRNARERAFLLARADACDCKH